MKRRSWRGILLVIGLAFGASASIRLGDGLGISLAHAADQQKTDEAQPGSLPAADESPSALTAALSLREASIASQELELQKKWQALEQASESLRGRLQALEEAEASLLETLALSDKAAEADLSRLTAVFDQMKPRDAVPLFEQMESRFAAGFLARMRPDAAAAVLAGMKPEIAWTVSAALAGRNTSVPTN